MPLVWGCRVNVVHGDGAHTARRRIHCASVGVVPWASRRARLYVASAERVRLLPRWIAGLHVTWRRRCRSSRKSLAPGARSSWRFSRSRPPA